MRRPSWATAAAALRMKPRPGPRPGRALEAALGEKRGSLSGEECDSREALTGPECLAEGGKMLGGSAGKEKGAVGKRIQKTSRDKAPEYPHPLARPRLGDRKLGSDPAAAGSISRHTSLYHPRSVSSSNAVAVIITKALDSFFIHPINIH